MVKILYSRNIFVALIFLLPVLAGAQAIQINTKSAAVDYEKLTKIDDLVNDYIARKWLTGADHFYQAAQQIGI